MHPSPLPIQTPSHKKRTARAVTVAVIGDWLQVFDFTVHGFFAATIGRLYFPANDSTRSLLLAVATFAAGFSARLLGSPLLGVHSDWQVARYLASMATAWAERLR